jgi:hypothetical protein
MITLLEYMQKTRDERRSHLKLEDACVERGGNSTNHKGVLAQYLDSEIPSGRKALLCHACHNSKCSNPMHLYWGTDKENLGIDRAEQPGGWKTPWEHKVEKYGYEEACKMNSRNMLNNQNGKGNYGKNKSEEHKKKIANSVKSLYNNT